MNAASGRRRRRCRGRRAGTRCPAGTGERSTSMSIRDESALTTDRPTPCRPPVATYEPPPNLPPACSLVATTSTPGSPVLGSLSVGMPRPSSWTSTEPSGCRVTSTRCATPGQGLVDAVVDDLPQAVHEAAGVGRPDVHAGPLAHRLEPLEDEEVRCVVGVVRRCCHKGRTYPRHAVRRRKARCHATVPGRSSVIPHTGQHARTDTDPDVPRLRTTTTGYPHQCKDEGSAPEPPAGNLFPGGYVGPDTDGEK